MMWRSIFRAGFGAEYHAPATCRLSGPIVTEGIDTIDITAISTEVVCAQSLRLC